MQQFGHMWTGVRPNPVEADDENAENPQRRNTDQQPPQERNNRNEEEPEE
jgi:hypothetical protein